MGTSYEWAGGHITEQGGGDGGRMTEQVGFI